jgi:hypothetical protein
MGDEIGGNHSAGKSSDFALSMQMHAVVCVARRFLSHSYSVFE